MKVIKGDIWEKHREGHFIVVPTNGFVKKDGTAVMGRGLAWQASKRYPELPKILGNNLKAQGNGPNYFYLYRLITFPVKHNWWEKADLRLIARSAEALRNEVNTLQLRAAFSFQWPIYLPKVGCGNGQLNWGDVEIVLDKYLTPDDFVVCDTR